MESNPGTIVRVLKRLKAAVGYHELGMTQHALRCLDSVAFLGEIGPFGLVPTSCVANSQEPRDHVSAAKALELVACMLPTPARHAMEMTLAACYGPVNEANVLANSVARPVVQSLKASRNLPC